MLLCNLQRRAYLRRRERFRRIIRAAERLIRREWPLFGESGIANTDSKVVQETIRSHRLREMFPDYAHMRRYWTRGGFRGFLREFNPANLDELAIANALYRPGPMATGLAESFLSGARRKPFHHDLRPILKPTRGTYVFAEQVVEALKSLAGFSTAQAHRTRRLLCRKESEGLRPFRRLYFRRLGVRGVPKQTAELLWAQLESEGGYTLSRDWAYESIEAVYRMAYLKVYFPKELRRAIGEERSLRETSLNLSVTEYLSDKEGGRNDSR